MRSLNRKTAIKLLTQNPKGCRSHAGYFGSEFGSGNRQTGDDQRGTAGLIFCAASLVVLNPSE